MRSSWHSLLRFWSWANVDMPLLMFCHICTELKRFILMPRSPNVRWGQLIWAVDVVHVSWYSPAGSMDEHQSFSEKDSRYRTLPLLFNSQPHLNIRAPPSVSSKTSVISIRKLVNAAYPSLGDTVAGPEKCQGSLHQGETRAFGGALYVV